MSKAKTTKKAAAPKATKKAPKAAPAEKASKAKKTAPVEQATDATAPVAEPQAQPAEKAPAKKRGTKKAAGEAKPKKLSAIDAAAQVLAGSKEPMNCKALIEAMAAQGLWTSPGGKTPAATLYSAILREITVKGKEARFVKTERGHFTAKG